MTREKVIKGLECCNAGTMCDECDYHVSQFCLHELKADAFTLIRELKSKADAYDQVKWERDIAVGQLEQIGKSLGEKMDDVKTYLHEMRRFQRVRRKNRDESI